MTHESDAWDYRNEGEKHAAARVLAMGQGFEWIEEPESGTDFMIGTSEQAKALLTLMLGVEIGIRSEYAPPLRPYCSRPGGQHDCSCGGNADPVRATCRNWVKPGAPGYERRKP